MCSSMLWISSRRFTNLGTKPSASTTWYCDPMVWHYKQHLSVVMQPCVSSGSASSASVAAAQSLLLQRVPDTGCCCHDVRNSPKWRLHLALQDMDLIRDTCVAVAAQRNSDDQLHHHFPDWLLRKVKFANPEQCVPPNEWTAVYQDLSVEADVVETVADMSLIFRDGCLEVSEARAERHDLMEALTGTLIYSWRLSRRLVLGLMTGIENLAHLVLGIKMESKVTPEWFRPHVRPRQKVCRHPGHEIPPSDSLLSALLEEDSVALYWLANQPDCVWGHFTRCLGGSFGL